ncbi:MAG: YigZ family protein [Clostridia bacterium]|nr:YigZ family protein [Clostridia bacterium]
MSSYKTVKQKACGEFTEKRSRFIGYACPVSTEEQANEFISEIKSKHWDARHNVYAYILKDGNFKKYSDDGEPQGTAGMPVLEVIGKSGLCDVCVVVTRYFGGILLGGGGLFRAYTKAASLALESACPVTMELCSVLSIKCDYSAHQKLQKLLEKNEAHITDTDYAEEVTVRFYVRNEDEKKIKELIFDFSGGKIRAEKTEERYLMTE